MQGKKKKQDCGRNQSNWYLKNTFFEQYGTSSIEQENRKTVLNKRWDLLCYIQGVSWSMCKTLRGDNTRPNK